MRTSRNSSITCPLPSVNFPSRAITAIGPFEIIDPDRWLFPVHGDVAEAKLRAKEHLEQHQNDDGAENQIEEFVRQRVLAQLLVAYKYPAERIGERIIIEEPVKMRATEKEADASIKSSNRRPFLHVAAKKRGIPEQEFKEAERQFETYLASTDTATIGMVTDVDRIRTLQKEMT